MTDPPHAAALRLTAQEERRLISKRIKRGECPVCGTAMFRLGLLGRKTPLRNRVTPQGTCAACHQEAAAIGAVPSVLEVIRRSSVKLDDNMTMVSGLTLPIDLLVGAQRMQNPVTGEPSHAALAVISPEETDLNSCKPHSKTRRDDRGASSSGANQRCAKAFSPPPRLLQQATLAAVQQYSQVNGIDTALSIKWEPEQLEVCNEESTVSTMSGPSPLSHQGRIHPGEIARMQRDVQPPGIADGVPQPQDFEISFLSEDKDTQIPRQQKDDTKSRPPEDSSKQCREPWINRQDSSKSLASRSYQQTSQILEAASVTEVIGLIRSMSLSSPSDRTTRVAALKRLSDMFLSSGSDAQQELFKCEGLETISSIIWSDMCDDVLQEAALTALFALVASSDGKSLVLIWEGDAAKDCMDALLVAMQTLVENVTIQSLGCKVFGCLARTSGSSDGYNDGSLSGAVWAVLTTIAEHDHCLEALEPGIRALYNYCTYSKYADSNKQTVTDYILKNYDGSAFFEPAFRLARSSPELCEWLCKLHSCFSTGQTKSIAVRGLQAILSVIWTHRKDQTSSSALLEVALSAAADVLLLEESHSVVDRGKTLLLALDVIRWQQAKCPILLKAFQLITIVCSDSASRCSFENVELHKKCLLKVYDPIRVFPTQDQLHVAALRALVSIAHCRDEFRDLLLEPILYAKLMQLRPRLLGSNHTATMVARLTACFLTSDAPAINPVLSDLVEANLSAIAGHERSESVVQAATHAFCEVLKIHHERGLLYVHDLLPAVLNMMERHERSESIQSNCCYILLQVAGCLESASRQERCLGRIICAIQTHIASPKVASVACDALLALIASSFETRQAFLLKSEAVGSVTSLFVAHPTQSVLLASAVQVVSHIIAGLPDDSTLSAFIGDLNNCLRRDIHGETFLTCSFLLLRQIKENHPGQLAALEEALPLVLESMKIHQANTRLQEEGCKLLLSLSHHNSSRQRIIDAGGVARILSVLECAENVAARQVAVDAFNQLALR